MAYILAISTMVGLALSQMTTFEIPYPLGADGIHQVSVITANKESTVLSIGCPENVDRSECGVFPYQTLTYGPSTWKMDMSVDGDSFTMTQDCSFGSGSAVCRESASGSEANFPGSSTETYTDGSMWVWATAGGEKLKAAADATPTPSGSQNPTASAGARNTGSETLATATQTDPNSSSGTPTSAEPSSAANIGTTASRLALLGAGVGVFASLFL
jgi:hypothetical protein